MVDPVSRLLVISGSIVFNFCKPWFKGRIKLH